MSSAAEAAADSAAYLDELTGARQTWIRQCQRALAPDGGTADWAPLTDDDGAWARALRTGRELPDPDDDLPLRPEIADVNAAHAIRTLARHLAGRDPVDPAVAVAPLLRHCDAAHLVSIGTGPFDPLRWLVNAAWTPHRDRLRDVVDHLAGTNHPAAPYVALLACHLTDALPAAGTPATVRVLFDRDSSRAADDAGTTGRLTLRVQPGGPPGLHPDPARMAFFTSVDDRFITSAANAWASADLSAAEPPVSVIWNLTVDGRNPAPANDVDGGSLGAAYAIALHELHQLHRRDQRWTRHVPFLRELDFRRRLTNPYAAATGTVVDPTGALGAVSGLDHKLEAARRAGISLVITAPGTPHDNSHPEPRLAAAATTREAIEQAHTHQNRSFRTTVTRVAALSLVVALLAGTAIYLGYQARAMSRRETAQERVMASERLLNEAVPMLANRPREALQLLEAAWTLNPSTAVRAALVEGLARTHYAGTIGDPSGGVQAVAVSPDGQIVASGTATPEGTGQLTLWELSPTSRARLTATISTSKPVRVLTFAPGGQTLYSGEADGAITVWDARDRTRPIVRQTLAVHTADVQAITVSPDGDLLGTAGSDGVVALLDRRDPDGLRRLQTLPRDKGEVFSVAFSPDGSVLVTGNQDGVVFIWSIGDVRKPQLVKRVSAHDGKVRSLSFGAEGRVLASASVDATINLWDLTQPGGPTLRETLNAGGQVFQATFSPDGRTLAGAGYNRAALLWDVPDRGPARPLATLSGHSNYIRSVAFTPDSRRVVTGSLDQTMIVWNVVAPGEPGTIASVRDREAPVRALAFSPDQHTLAAAGDGGAIHLYGVDSLKSPRLTRTLPSPAPRIWDLVYSPDGRWLAASDEVGVIRVWDAGAGATDPPQVLVGPGGPEGPIYNLAFDPAGRRLAAGSEAGTVALWDLGDPAPRQVAHWRGHNGGVHAVSFDPADPQRLATAAVDTTVKVWDVGDVSDPKPLATLTGQDEAVLTAGYSPSGSVLVSGSVDATTALWTDTRTGQPPTAKLTGHTLNVRTQTFIADDQLVTGSDDGTAVIYSLIDPGDPVPIGATRPGQPKAGPTLNQAVLDTAYSRHTLANSTRSGNINLYDLTALDQLFSKPHDVACRLTQSGLSEDAWAKNLPGLPYEPSCPG